MANPRRYGFRWSTANSHGPVMESMIVATSQSFDVNGGAANVNLGAGDPVILLSTGGVNLCDGIEGAGGVLAPYGICMGIDERGYWNAATGKMQESDVLPSDVAWGTNLERQSRVLVTRIESGIWEVDGDTASFTTEATNQALVGQNVNHILTGTSGQSRAYPMIDISETATTSSFQYNIVGISRTVDNRDWTAAYVKYLVRANVIQLKSAGVTGV